METAEAAEREQFETDPNGDDEDIQEDISRLNDDILLYIFMFLTRKDRVKIERGI